jgi:hypothetical protein
MTRKRTRIEPNPMEGLKENLAINRDDLDFELEAHAALVYQVSEYLAIALADKDTHKDLMRARESGCAVRAKDELEESGMKTTVADVNRKMELDIELIDDRETMRTLNSKAFLWEQLREAFKSRGFMLHSLAEIMKHRMAANAGVSE